MIVSEYAGRKVKDDFIAYLRAIISLIQENATPFKHAVSGYVLDHVLIDHIDQLMIFWHLSHSRAGKDQTSLCKHTVPSEPLL